MDIDKRRESFQKDYPAEDIAKIFMQIDQQLIDLHECSTKDFMGLNSEFKSLFNQLSQISDNINFVSNFYNNSAYQQNLDEIRLFCDSVNNQLIKEKNKKQEINRVSKRLSEQFALLFIPIKNCSQQTMILKYILTNLKLLAPLEDQNQSQELLITEKEIDLISEKINNNLNQLTYITTLFLSPEANLSGQNSITEDFIYEILEVINNLENHFNTNKECIKNIDNENFNSSESISDIIKKLQYHDIIKQKMEHIQKTQKDVIKELKRVDESSDTDLDEKKNKIYNEIKDIARMQSAQLIQTNKEYHKAIETIVNNFMNVFENIDFLKGVFKIFYEGKASKHLILYNNLSEKVNLIEEQSSKRINSNKNNYIQLKKNQQQLSNIESNFNELEILHINLQKNVKFYQDKIIIGKINDANTNKVFSQVDSVSQELSHNINTIKNLLESLTKIKLDYNKLISESEKIFDKIPFDEFKVLIKKLEEEDKQIVFKINENQNIGNNSLENIKKSIADIKYYDYFEKVIEDIIKELNLINTNLKQENGLQDETLSDNLSKLRQYYTIESEHTIHDNITNNDETDIENKEDGNIEFF
ncbi:MAG: hypothetical protein JEY96_01840 [Bacteroidales bacterium]|nr:hypothetical protein [Bacteroidales bacterium]